MQVGLIAVPPILHQSVSLFITRRIGLLYPLIQVGNTDIRFDKRGKQCFSPATFNIRLSAPTNGLFHLCCGHFCLTYKSARDTHTWPEQASPQSSWSPRWWTIWLVAWKGAKAPTAAPLRKVKGSESHTKKAEQSKSREQRFFSRQPPTLSSLGIIDTTQDSLSLREPPFCQSPF